MKDVYIRAGVGKGVAVTSCNDIKIITPHFFGFSTPTFTHGIHAISGSDVTVIDPDLEVCGVGLEQSADCKVTLISGYTERCTRHWYNNGNSSGAMTVIGGRHVGTNSGTICGDINGGNCTVIGGHYTANGGAGLTLANAATKPPNVHLLGVSGDIADTYNWATTGHNTDISGWHKTTLQNYKTAIADNVATSIFRVVVPNATTNWGYVDVDIYAALTNTRLSHWTGRYRISFGVSGGAIVATSVTEYAKANVNSSVNYGLAVTVTAANAIPNLDIQITCNSSGASGEGTTSFVMAEATLVQGTDSGAVYLITQ